ncbi:MAG: glycosyltransferase family 2 protein [Methylocella sp.]
MLLPQTTEITVIISVKDRPKELWDAVSSVYEQTILPRELIIVDDSSAVPVAFNQSPAAPVGLSLNILRNEYNLGGAKSLNIASKVARCPIIAFLDSDDCFLPEYLEKVSSVWCHTDTNTVCIGTGSFWCTDDLIPYRIHNARSTVTLHDLLALGNIVGGSSVLSVRRQAFVSAGGYPLCRGSHDWGMLINLAKIGTIQTLPEPLVLYRSPSTNPRSTYSKNFREQIISIKYICRIQSPANRVIMLPRLRKLSVKYLALMRRRRMAWRMFRSAVYHDRKITKDLLQMSWVLLTGPDIYDRILLSYALIRARFFGRKLLSAHKKA